MSEARLRRVGGALPERADESEDVSHRSCSINYQVRAGERNKRVLVLQPSQGD